METKDTKETNSKEIFHLGSIENPELERTPIKIEGIVSSTSIAYLVPREVDATWLTPKRKDLKQKDHTIDPSSPDTIKFVGISDSAKRRLLADIMEVPTKATFDEFSHRICYRLRLRPRVFTLEQRGEKILDERGFEYKAFDVYIVSDDNLNLTPSTRVILDGYSLPDPKTQRATFLASAVHFPEAVEAFDREALERLGARWHGLSVRQRVDWILENFELFSHLVGRRNLAYAGLLAYFTPVWIEFDGDRQRGWGLVLIIGDTTTGKSETILKLIMLLRAGTLITAETASAVGLTAAAIKQERGEWFTDYGFLVLNDRRLLAIDGYQRLSTHAQATTSEAERRGVVVKGTAAKGSAPAKTRQIKIGNPKDLDAGRYSTKAIVDFYHPILSVASIQDKTGIGRLDLAVISDERRVRAEEVNVPRAGVHDPDLELLSEVLKWTWSGPKVEFTEDAVKHILKEATRLYEKFYSPSVPLVGIDMKWKLARLSTALASLTLSATPDFDAVIVTREHVEEVVHSLEGEYQEAGLHILSKSEVHEAPTEDDLNQLLYDLDNLGLAEEKSRSILTFIAMKGRVTKDVLRTEFSLADKGELRPLVAILQGRELIKTGRGYYPTTKLIQLSRLI